MEFFTKARRQVPGEANLEAVVADDIPYIYESIKQVDSRQLAVANDIRGLSAFAILCYLSSYRDYSPSAATHRYGVLHYALVQDILFDICTKD